MMQGGAVDGGRGLVVIDAVLRWVPTVLLLSVMLVPMRLYSFDLPLGVAVDPNRLLIAAVIGGLFWLAMAGLWKPPQRVLASRGSVLVGLFVITATISIAVNAGDIATSGAVGRVLGNFANLAVFVAYFAVFASLVRSRADVERAAWAFVGGATAVAALAVVERYTGYNVFAHFDSWLPGVHKIVDRSTLLRSDHIRASASAQHPIALGVVCLMAAPFAVWLWHRCQSGVGVGKVVLVVSLVTMLSGSLASGSRTVLAALVVMAFVAVAAIGRRALTRVAPAVAVLLIVVNFVVLPGSVAGIAANFAPDGGLRAEQTGQAGSTAGGRLGDIDSVERSFLERPLFGVGFGTRVFTGEGQNALILDDEYLGRLVESGCLGALSLAALIWVPALAELHRARRAVDDDRTLHAALAAAMAGYGTALLTLDGFSFFQLTIVFFVVLGISNSVAVHPIRTSFDDGSPGLRSFGGLVAARDGSGQARADRAKASAAEQGK